MSNKIEREGLIFVAGDYPDKQVSVTEDDLDEVVKNFKPVDVDIEHSSTPFDGILGTLSKVYKKGKELWGTFSFEDVAWRLIEKAGAKKCSVSYNPELKTLTGIGLVKNPRVKSAQIFNEGDKIQFDDGYILDNPISNVQKTMMEEKKTMSISNDDAAKSTMSIEDAKNQRSESRIR